VGEKNWRGDVHIVRNVFKGHYPTSSREGTRDEVAAPCFKEKILNYIRSLSNRALVIRHRLMETQNLCSGSRDRRTICGAGFCVRPPSIEGDIEAPERSPPGGDWRSEVAGCVNGRYLRLAESGLTEDRSPPTRPYPRASQQSASVPEHDRGGSSSLSRNCGCDSAVVRPRKDNTSSFREEGAPISLSCSRKSRNGAWPLFTPPAKISPYAGQLGQWWILTDLAVFRASDRAHAWFFWSWGRHRPAGLRDSFPNPAEAEFSSNGGWFETRRFVEQPAEVGAQPTDRRASMSLRDPAGSR
jgi:hypothetical protein